MKNPTDTDEAFLSEPWFVFYFQRENEKCCKKNWLCLTHAAFLVAVGKQYALALSPLLSTSCKNLFLMLQDFSKYNHFLKENQLDYTGKYLRKAEIIAPIITGEPGTQRKTLNRVSTVCQELKKKKKKNSRKGKDSREKGNR
ncbi:uncharacterized protein LOC143694170 isoform X3 [Agelaius phoeniceus]|uniref:uncharacterized protein LOC143694170 isoform X3 n=1 Tax=Agelaius phoeniceus TaxID=39638 RepID=UPI004054F5E4